MKWIPLEQITRKSLFNKDVIIGANSFYAYGQTCLQRGILKKTKFPSHSFCVLLHDKRINIRMFANNSVIITGCVSHEEIIRALTLIAQEAATLSSKTTQVDLMNLNLPFSTAVGHPFVGHDFLLYDEKGLILGYWRKRTNTYMIHNLVTHLSTLATCCHTVNISEYHSALCFVEKQTSLKQQTCFVCDARRVFSTRGDIIGHIHSEAMFNTTTFVPVDKITFHRAMRRQHSSSDVNDNKTIVSSMPLPFQVNAKLQILSPSNMLASGKLPITFPIHISYFIQKSLRWKAIANTVKQRGEKQFLFTCILSKQNEECESLTNSLRLDSETFGVSDCTLPIRKCSKCKKVTVCVFRSGSVIVTGLQSWQQTILMCKFFEQLIKNE